MSVKVISFSNQITYLDDGNHLLLATFIQVWVNICFNFILHVFRVPEHSLNFNKKHHNKLLSKLILSWTELIERVYLLCEERDTDKEIYCFLNILFT